MLSIALQSFLLIPLLFFGSLGLGNSLSLSTSARWVVDMASGRRVKLSCVNWVAHMQPMVAEGLDKKPLQDIASKVASLGFNCVRLTWATYMFTRTQPVKFTVAQSLNSLGLGEAAIGIVSNNPSLFNLTLLQAYDAVVDQLGTNGLMVVLDNHVSRPQWCCGDNDGNGFFGDTYFDPEEWLQGLDIVAKRFSGKSQVVGMSIRNELRGPRQSETDWYRYIRRGVKKIHKANPNVLVIVSGLNYDTELSFLKGTPLGVNLDNKLVYEAHWYSFSEGNRLVWKTQPPGQVCADAIRRLEDRAGFVMEGDNPVPMFISEFGVDQTGENPADNRFLSCFLAFAVERDMDWAMWALQGSYYLRNGQAGFEETYGVLDGNWDQTRNPKFQERFRLLQEIIQDPRSDTPTYHIIFHPLSGLCVRVNENNSVEASDCRDRSHWSYEGGQAPIRLLGTGLCLGVTGDGLPVTLSSTCSSEQSNWSIVSSSKLHVAAKDVEGRALCLEINSSNSSTILTSKCVCSIDDNNCDENLETKWFKLIPTNLKLN
ncbi:glycosyl hydrolase 5 family protein-like [Telopea speciosissima]|uniref:glycosyl hydrolase 5 family protein-like n=1 Tax=Telopea speciosissima TaxID=54955 RepID=UPI001CC5D1F4|nr:glycosyl hydrolase 5 family protein-like [Telopea speciosissima]